MRKNNFYYRMRRTFAITVLIPVTILVSVFSYVLSVSNKKQMCDVFDNQTQMLVTHINGLIDNMDFITMELLSRSDFLDSIKQFYFSSNTNRQKYSEIADNMVSYKYFQKTYEITYLEERGYYCSTAIPVQEYQKIHQIDPEQFIGSNWFQKVLEENGSPVLVNIGENGNDSADGTIFALARSIAVPKQRIGCLYVQVDLSNNSVLEPLYEYDATWAVYAPDGSKLCCDSHYPSDTINLNVKSNKSAQIVQTANGEKYIASISAGDNEEFYVAGLYPAQLLRQSTITKLLPYLVLTVVLLAIEFWFINWYSKYMSEPLSQLADMMQKTTLDNIKQPHHFHIENSPDEITSLYQSYSKMADRIVDMVQEKIEWTEKLADQRYQYLQYQINPHFLYNTLNVIGIMGAEAGQKSIFDSCKTLTLLLRYSLVDFMKPSTFKEEFASIHAYLNLMKLRFEHKVSYEVDYDDDLNNYYLPRFSIQPFVENVFEHAFDEEHPQITIKIHGYIKNDRWIITITDDGKGFDYKKAKEIETYIEEYKKKPDLQFQTEDGIGVVNTIIRLMVFFKQNFSYDIQTNAENGCKIELSGALKRRENE